MAHSQTTTHHKAHPDRGQSHPPGLDPDYHLFLTLARGECEISSFRAADLRVHLAGRSQGRASYLLQHLRTHRLIKKVANRYKYYLTKLGRRVLVTARVIREYFVQPASARIAL